MIHLQDESWYLPSNWAWWQEHIWHACMQSPQTDNLIALHILSHLNYVIQDNEAPAEQPALWLQIPRGKDAFLLNWLFSGKRKHKERFPAQSQYSLITTMSWVIQINCQSIVWPQWTKTNLIHHQIKGQNWLASSFPYEFFGPIINFQVASQDWLIHQ